MRTFAILALLLAAQAMAQKQGNIWYFGDHAGLDFGSGTPVEITDGQTQFVDCPSCHAEGSAVICDSTGSLLFYSDGARAWDALHQVMPNGDSLMSNASATQSALILPRPGSDHVFFLFTVDDFHINDLLHGFRYSVVDMCLNGSNGDVVEGQKNILITDSVAEKLAGVRHANGTDYWVLVHKWQSDAFHAYPLTALGVGAPVISNVGSVHPVGMGGIASSIGQLKVAPNGTKLAIANGNSTPSILEYFDFDPATGVVSNAVPLVPNPYWMYYGVAFSPDNSKLYAAVTMNGNGVYQFDLNAGGGDPVAVAASVTQIAFTHNYLGLQLAVDGKIYVARSPFSNNPNIGIIHSPNAAGVACNYQDAAIVLTGGLVSYGFPSFVDSYDYSNGRYACETAIANDPASTTGPFLLVVNGRLLPQLTSNAPAQLDLMDASGRLIRSHSLAQPQDGCTIDDLAPGLYLARVHQQGSARAGRFLKE